VPTVPPARTTLLSATSIRELLDTLRLVPLRTLSPPAAIRSFAPPLSWTAPVFTIAPPS
jgi:hypothetical protein